ncbi:MAG: hypothetical protein ACRD0P_06925 [Stackebrandtia sp.]
MDAYLARGLVSCGVCGGLLLAVQHSDAARAYSCGPACPQHDLPALSLEQDLLLRALVRAYAALHGVGRPGSGSPVASAEEVRRWQWTDLSDRRAVIETAFLYVTVDADGEPHPRWRHQTDAATGSAQ